MPGVLGIDLGTQGVTALVADLETGRPLGVAGSPLSLHAGPGGVREQDPEMWWDALVEAVRSFDGLLDVQAVAVAGQQHGLVCLDGEGRSMGPASLWNDTSAHEWVQSLTALLGGPEAVRRIVGMDLKAGYTAPQLARLRDVDPHRYDRAAIFCLPHDYLTARLCGVPVTDAGDASGTGYFDIRTRDWSDEILEALHPNGGLRHRLPPVAPPGVAVGGLTKEAARALELREGLAVVSGTGDNMACAVGMGMFAPGRLGLSLGTSGTAFAYSAQPAVDPLGEAAAFCDATGAWLPLVCTLNCTRVLHLASAMFGVDLGTFEEAAAKTDPLAGGLTFFPYLDGERTPPLREGSAMVQGLRPGNMSAACFARAAFEGVTMALVYGLDALDRAGVTIDSVVLAGGGANSALWRQIMADTIGVEVRRTPTDEPTAWGAAAIAAWALSGEPVEDIMRRWWRGAGPGAVSVTRPDPVAHEVYAEEVARRRELMGQLYPEAMPLSLDAVAPPTPPSRDGTPEQWAEFKPT